MEQIIRFQGTPDDVAEAVAACVARSRFLYDGGQRYVVLIEESVLRYRTVLDLGPDLEPVLRTSPSSPIQGPGWPGVPRR